MHNSPKNLSFKKIFLLTVGLCLLISCSVEIEEHGKRIETDLLDKIVPGSTQKEQVLSILGAPSTENDFGNKAWFYIASNNKQTALFGDKLVSRSIIKIMFNITPEKRYSSVSKDSNDSNDSHSSMSLFSVICNNV